MSLLDRSGGLIGQLTARVIERALGAEMDDHLGYVKGDPAGNGTGNSRNGSFGKTVTTTSGLYLTFSAITTTRNGGNDWATVPPASGLADVPDALAAAPDGRLIALGGNQQVTVTGPGGGWATLTTRHALAATPAARSCALTGLTAAAYTPAGSPVLAGHAGTPAPPASSPTPAGHGTRPGPGCPPRWPGSPCGSCG